MNTQIPAEVVDMLDRVAAFDLKTTNWTEISSKSSDELKFELDKVNEIAETERKAVTMLELMLERRRRLMLDHLIYARTVQEILDFRRANAIDIRLIP